MAAWLTDADAANLNRQLPPAPEAPVPAAQASVLTPGIYIHACLVIMLKTIGYCCCAEQWKGETRVKALYPQIDGDVHAGLSQLLILEPVEQKWSSSLHPSCSQSELQHKHHLQCQQLQ